MNSKNIGAIIKDLEMLRLVADHLKSKRMFKHAVEKLPFLIKYVADWYTTQRICDKVILGNGGIIMFISDFCKEKKCEMMLL